MPKLHFYNINVNYVGSFQKIKTGQKGFKILKVKEYKKGKWITNQVLMRRLQS